MNLFKPDDWIILSNSSDSRSLAQVKETYSNSNKAKLYWPSENSTAVCSEMQYYELWQPKVGEWCWFWDENYTTAILAKFENISNGLFVEHHGNIFEYCEPFIGQLPTHLKDQS